MIGVTSQPEREMAVPEQQITLEQFLELPEEEPALEYEEGWVTQKGPPKGRHAALQLAIANLVNDVTVPNKIARALPELRATYGQLSRVPDIAVYLWDRIPRDAKGRIADDFFDPPDLAIEIVSPGQVSMPSSVDASHSLTRTLRLRSSSIQTPRPSASSD
jgi:Uma2 family endonuclease